MSLSNEEIKFSQVMNHLPAKSYFSTPLIIGLLILCGQRCHSKKFRVMLVTADGASGGSGGSSTAPVATYRDSDQDYGQYQRQSVPPGPVSFSENNYNEQTTTTGYQQTQSTGPGGYQSVVSGGGGGGGETTSGYGPAANVGSGYVVGQQQQQPVPQFANSYSQQQPSQQQQQQPPQQQQQQQQSTTSYSGGSGQSSGSGRAGFAGVPGSSGQASTGNGNGNSGANNGNSGGYTNVPASRRSGSGAGGYQQSTQPSVPALSTGQDYQGSEAPGPTVAPPSPPPAMMPMMNMIPQPQGTSYSSFDMMSMMLKPQASSPSECLVPMNMCASGGSNMYGGGMMTGAGSMYSGMPGTMPMSGGYMMAPAMGSAYG